MKFCFFVFLFISGISNGQYTSPQADLNAKIRVRFAVQSLLYGMVEGEFLTTTGQAIFNKENVHASSFDFDIHAASVETGNNGVNKFISGDAFFSIENYPIIRFKSTGLSKVLDEYIVFGELIVKGIKKDVQIAFTHEDKNHASVLNGSFEINRFDFNLGEKFKPFWVKETVSIQVDVTLSNNSSNKFAVD